MRIAVIMAGFAVLCACSTAKPAETVAVAKPAAAAPAAAAAPSGAPPAAAPAKSAAAKSDCRRVKELGSIKYKEECRTRSESADAAKAGQESREAAARAIQGAAGLN